MFYKIRLKRRIFIQQYSSLIPQTALTQPDIVFYDALNPPFQIYGVFYDAEDGGFRRIPRAVAESTNEGIEVVSRHTAGGRVRFTTDSAYVAIQAELPAVDNAKLSYLSATGFDLCLDRDGESAYCGSFYPLPGSVTLCESAIGFPARARRSFTVNFPLQNGVKRLRIGLQRDAGLWEGMPYRPYKPILYYGSSITQGGNASRPGNAYQSILARGLNCDFINLGLSGRAKAEQEILDYMATLDISVFVCDYDHNAKTLSYLADTHPNVYRTLRAASPGLPILFLSRPDFDRDYEDSVARRDIIYSTYAQALREGDKNVYFLDGQRLFHERDRDCCTVDGCHPNDLGFQRMAETIGSMLRPILATL